MPSPRDPAPCEATIDLLLLVLLALGAFVVWRRRRRGPVAARLVQRGVRTGPVPGYARIEPPHLDTARIRDALPEGLPPWSLLSFETFNTSARKRSAMRIAVATDPDGSADRHALWTLAHLLGQIGRAMTGSDVLVVEVHTSAAAHLLDPPMGVVLLAADGRGWNGDVSGVRCVESCRSGAPTVVDALPGTAAHPGFGWSVPSNPFGPES